MVYDLRVVNTGNQDLPLSPGLHPYWRVNNRDKSKIKIDGIEGFDATQIDWDNNPPDTLYDYNGPVTVILPDKRVAIEDITDGKPQVKKIVTGRKNLKKTIMIFCAWSPFAGKRTP